MTGYIKLFRDIEQSDIWNMDEPFSPRDAWIDLLLLASHKDHQILKNGKVIESKRGQVNRSVTQLADKWQWSRGKVRRYLSCLEKMQMVTIKRYAHGQVLTIENYAKWQDGQNADGRSTDSRRTVDGQSTDSPRTVDGHIQEGKEGIEGERMIKNGERESSGSEIIDDAHAQFLQARKEGRFN